MTWQERVAAFLAGREGDKAVLRDVLESSKHYEMARKQHRHGASDQVVNCLLDETLHRGLPNVRS